MVRWGATTNVPCLRNVTSKITPLIEKWPSLGIISMAELLSIPHERILWKFIL